MENIYDVADYFLGKQAMTHKKLQKLCYFSQAWYLANYNEPLVPNRFEAWVHGPVCPDLYHKYHSWGWAEIPMVKEMPCFENNGTRFFLDRVFETYGSYTADELENITHQEMPWVKARNGCAPGAYSRNPIALKDMRDYYGERIGRAYS